MTYLPADTSLDEYTSGWVLDLFKDDGPDRLEMFRILTGLGFEVPTYGMPKDLLRWHSPDELCVVYLKPWSLQGRDKERMTIARALEEHPEKLCSWWIPKSVADGLDRSVSYRLLKIGRKTFYLRFQSFDPWRSNWSPQIETRVGSDGWITQVRRPIWAVDLVRHGADRLLATDFNIRPGVSQPEVIAALPGLSIIEPIREWFELFGTDVETYPARS